VPNRIGEYDLLEEIARGGMGVVYRARHRQLGRLVALKMILAGRFASVADVQRFLVEAEAAAQLDHPGIVPIYEIGEHQGQRYFAMKLIEGGNLAERLASLRADVPSAVALLARVARAVQHAHERGILHRDLKPSNILLDIDGLPLVTDFGLAKHLAGPGGQGGSDLTQSGAIVGTPSYMAPEQAGSARQVTTAADVYALGAMLYELLAGRPPHVGPSAVEIVVSLLSGEVQSPSELNAHVDRDLELICLKCLVANPAQRYASAAALADDLEHWLAGEPISLRASSLPTLFRTWLRENLRSAGRTLAVGLTWGVLIGVLVWLWVNQGVSRLGPLYDRLPSVPRPWIVYSPVLPPWWQLVAFVLLMVVVGMMGFATAIMVRPATRHAAVASGLGVGLLSAVTSLALSLGWGPLAAKSLRPISEDLGILGDAAFFRSGTGAPHPSDRLLAKYPDLEKVPNRYRGSLVVGKMSGDVLAGLIAGLWWGILLSLLVCLVPGVSGTVTAWSLLKQHGSVRRSLLPYTELAATVTILTALFAYYVMGPEVGAGVVYPEPGWLVAVMSSCGLAVGAIASGWRVSVRVLIHALWIGTLVLFAFHEADYNTLERQAAQHVQAQEWRPAIEQFEHVLRRQPDLAWVRFQTAIVCLRAGEQDAYLRHCRELLDEARGTSDPRIADRASKVCLLGGDQPMDLPLAAELADRAVRLGAGDSAYAYFLMVRGMAAYRMGDHTEALDWLRKSHQGNDLHRTTTALAFEAMALKSLNRGEEAILTLKRADAAFGDLMSKWADSAAGPLGPSWFDVLIFQIARSEAEKVVEHRSGK
jgi:tetratricopeptide (TPR) repeat protein